MADDNESNGYTRGEGAFLAVFTVAVGVAWYLVGPGPEPSRAGSALAAALVAFVVTAVALRLSSERARQTLIDVVSFLLP